MDSQSLTLKEALKYAREAFAPYEVETHPESRDSFEVAVKVDNYCVRVAHLQRGTHPSRKQYLADIQAARTNMKGIGARFNDWHAGERAR